MHLSLPEIVCANGYVTDSMDIDASIYKDNLKINIYMLCNDNNECLSEGNLFVLFLDDGFM